MTHNGNRFYWKPGPISRTEPSKFVMCILHLRLSFANTLWSYCIKASVRENEVACKLNNMLQKDGINVRKVKAIKGTSDLESIQQTRFTGNPADKFNGPAAGCGCATGTAPAAAPALLLLAGLALRRRKA